MLAINDTIAIPESEFEWSFVRSGGPGGQNVNKVASKAVLRWHLADTQSLPAEVLSRFRIQQRHRITTEGDLVLSSQRYRDQDRNRTDCLEKLRAMVLQALAVPKARKKTKPGRAAHQRRLTAKRHRSTAKERRRTPVGD
jgi:ribosome-associated protein